jgi:hypothetical protein
MHKNSVLFFTQNQWAFGQIHHALIKRLVKYGIYAHLLDFYREYTHEEYYYLASKFETFVTTPEAVAGLLHHGIPLERIVAVAHAERDVVGGVSNSSAMAFNQLKAFGVINPSLEIIAKNLGVTREAQVVRNGIDFDHFYAPVAPGLRVVGYAGANYHPMSNNRDCKRAYLLDRVMSGSKLTFRDHPRVNHLCMSGYYPTVDAILVTSDYEACGLPAMEAAAAGRLAISSAVGYFDGNYGALCRLPDDEFVSDAKEALARYQDPRLYKEICEKSQQHIRDNYDWSHTVEGWVKLLQG